MKLVPSKRIGFTPSPSPDVAGTRLYFVAKGLTPTYDGPFVDLGLLTPTTVTLPDGTSATLRVADTSLIPAIEVTAEDIYLVDYDAVGNLSDFSEPVTVPLDHVAPPAPAGLVVLT